MLDIFANRCLEFEPVGSRVTCSPPPQDTDADYLCLLERGSENSKSFIRLLRDNGFTNESESGTGYGNLEAGNFESWRMAHWNFIVTYDRSWYDLFMTASNSCKEKNLLVKADRIAEFERIMGDAKEVEKESNAPRNFENVRLRERRRGFEFNWFDDEPIVNTQANVANAAPEPQPENRLNQFQRWVNIWEQE